MVFRNEAKFAKRGKVPVGTVHANSCAACVAYSPAVLRLDTARLMLVARARLIAAKGHAKRTDVSGDPLYLDSDVQGGIGIGKNVMREKDRVAGIRAYTLFIQFIALRTLVDACRNGICTSAQAFAAVMAATSKASLDMAHLDAANTVLESTESNWNDAASMMAAAGVLWGETTSAKDKPLEHALATIAAEIASAVKKSKAKDWHRGNAIIPDYDAVHGTVDHDDVVRQAEAMAASYAAPKSRL